MRLSLSLPLRSRCLTHNPSTASRSSSSRSVPDATRLAGGGRWGAISSVEVPEPVRAATHLQYTTSSGSQILAMEDETGQRTEEQEEDHAFDVLIGLVTARWSCVSPHLISLRQTYD